MSLRSRAALLAASLAALLFFAPAARSADVAPYEINVVLSLTGQGAFIGNANQAMLRALETVVNKHGGIKGRPIHFLVYDDQTNPAQTVQLANAIIAKKVPAFLGASITATCRAIVPLVQNGPVEYCLSPGIHPVKGSYTFSVSVDTRDVIVVALRYLREMGWHRIARLTTTDATGQDADAAFADALKLPENRDLTIVDDEHFNAADVSVAAQLAKIKGAQPQAFIIWASGTPLGTALRGLLDSGLDVPVAVNNSNMTTVQMKQYAGILPKQFFSEGPPYVAGSAATAAARRAQREYLDAIKTVNVPNDYISGIAWDAAMILVNSLNALGTDASAEQVRDYIEHLHGYSGIGGVYDFTDGSQRGLTQNDTMMMRWNAAKNGWDAVSKLGGLPIR